MSETNTQSRSKNLGALVDLAASGNHTLLIDCREAGQPVHWDGHSFEAQCDAIARALTARGLEPGARVAILSANRAEYLQVYYGTMRAGLISVPVNTRLPAQTIHYVLEDSGAEFAFVDNERAALVPKGLPMLNFDDAKEFSAFLDPGPFTPIEPALDDVAMFLYTSGSTGKPKGVPLTHHGHLWVVRKRIQAGVDYTRERLLVAAPLYHMNALATAKFAQYVGATMVLLPQFTAASYINAIATHRCTWLTSVPTMLALVCQERQLLAATDLGSVTSVRMGSAPVTLHLLNELRELFKGTKIQLGYGTTEAGPIAFAPHPHGLPTPDLSLGVAHPDISLRLTDASGNLADEGVLEMRCPALTPGYHTLPDKTASVMTADDYYRTGDVMRRDANGFYYFVGRDDDMFVCNGENVFPEGVERLLEKHPAVTQACVVPVSDAVRGAMPVAFVVPANADEPDVDELKQFTIANGPAYQHPRRIWFQPTLPLAGTNKIDRKQLADEARHRVKSEGLKTHE